MFHSLLLSLLWHVWRQASTFDIDPYPLHSAKYLLTNDDSPLHYPVLMPTIVLLHHPFPGLCTFRRDTSFHLYLSLLSTDTSY